MTTLDDILSAQKLLNVKLYGENGFEGDIPELKKLIKTFCDKHQKLERNFNWLIGILIGTGLISGGIIGATNLLAG